MKTNQISNKIREKEYPTYRKRVLTAIEELSGCIRVKYDKTNGNLKKEKTLIYLGKNCQL